MFTRVLSCNRLTAVIGLAAVALLSACDSAQVVVDTNPASSTTAVTPSLGLVQNATVNFYAANGTTLLGMGETGADGRVNVTVSNHTGPIVVEVLGDDVDARYYDEAAGTLLAFPAGQRMRALVAGPGGAVGVTPLTEVAYQAALLEGAFPLTVAAVNAINEQVRAALAPGLVSILSVPTLVDGATAANSLQDNEAGRYALVLAALAELANGQAAPALAVLQALAADASDGVIDGQNGAGSVNAPYGNFITDMSAALNTAAGTYANASLQANAPAQAPQSTTVGDDDGGNGGGNDGPNGTTQAATVNASLVSQFMLVATSNQSGSPFTDDQMVMAVVTGDGTLQIDDGPVLGNPFERDSGNGFTGTEIIWLDTAADIEYALSNNSTGRFNEINVGDASAPVGSGVPAFLGQLVQQSTGGGGPANIELVQALAGTYTVSEVVDGMHSRGTVTIAADGALDYDTDLAFAVDDYDAVFDRRFLDEPAYFIETTNDGSGPRFDLLLDDNDNLIGVRYHPMGFGSDGGSEVAFASSETSDPETGNNGPTTLAAVANNGITGIVNGTEYTDPDDITLTSFNDGRFFLQASGNNSTWRIQVTEAVGTYACSESGQDPSPITLQHLTGAGTGPNTGDGARDGDCTIKVVQAGPIYEGFFTGTLISNSETPLPVTDGYFYHDPANPNDTGSASDDDPLGAAETGVSGVVDGIRTTIVSSNAYNDLGSGYFGVNITDSNGPDGATRRWTMRAPLEEGSHPCNFANNERAFNTEISLFDGVDFFSASGDTGCTITVTSLTSEQLEATFSGNAAVFRNNMLQGVTIQDGVVRLAAPQ